MKLADFDYDLPEHLIAQHPLAERSASRLLRVTADGGACSHHGFGELIDWLTPKDLLVFNNTRVIPARLYGAKDSGGKIEVLIERVLDDHRAIAHIKSSKSPKIGRLLLLEPQLQARVVKRHADLFELEFLHETPVLDLLYQHGQIPLPHYMNRSPEAEDLARYQTVYAKYPGAVAAPTAGLHFDDRLLEALRERKIPQAFVTLHVGAGTFQPIRSTDLREHQMHAEQVEVSTEVCWQVEQCRQRGGRVIAVGTTSVRALETAAASGTLQAYHNDSRLFIYPGYRFQCVDVLITNFHLPRSTLLLLVSAFAGQERILSAYKEAIAQQYRFFSYGDAMWLTRQD